MTARQNQAPIALDIAELPDSAQLLDRPDELRARWAEDGVLYFHDVIDRAAVAKIRDEYLVRLKEVGVVDPHEVEANWNGRNRVDGNLARPIDDRVWRELVSDPSLDRVVRTFLAEAPIWVPIVVHRSAPPAPKGMDLQNFGARHQDGVYNYGIDFITCWIPLMDIADEVGGLAVVPGSHKASLYPRDTQANPDLRIGIPSGAIPDAAWRRPKYRAGDLLMFHSMTAHTGLPNRSDKIRLSTDIRFLPESVATPLIGKVIAVEPAHFEFRQESGETTTVRLGDATIVRGPKGTPVFGDERKGIVFQGAEVIVVLDDRGVARLIRSVSRKYVDLPADWYDPLPCDWVR